MRLSSSLLLILAAISVSKAALLEQTLHPQHHLAAVKKGGARVNALDTAKVRTHPVDVKNLKDLVKVAAKRGVDVSTLGNTQAHVADVDLKSVASMVHGLSSHLESVSASADKLVGDKLTAETVHNLLSHISVSLASTISDIHGLTSASAKTDVAKVELLRRAGLLNLVSLKNVSHRISNRKVAGSGKLTQYLSEVKLNRVLQRDVLSILKNTHVVSAIHDTADADKILKSVLAVPSSIQLISAVKDIDHLDTFVDALVDVKHLNKFVAAVPGGVDSISKLGGGAKMTKYAKKFGTGSLAKLTSVSGASSVLETVKKVPASVKILKSLKHVSDVPAFVSGLHALDVTKFVTSIQAVKDLGALDTVLSDVHSIAPVKRDVLDTVKGVTSGLDLQRVLSLKRAIAHIAALPASKLVSVDANAKRDLLEGVESTVKGLNVADLKVLKRELLDGVETAVKGLHVANVDVLKRALLDGIESTVKGLNLGKVADLKVLKRALLDNVEATVKGLNVADAKVLNVADAKVLKRELLDGVESTVKDLDVAQLTVLKRAIADLSALDDGELDSLTTALKRDVLSGLNLSDATNLNNVDLLQSQHGILSGLDLEHIAAIKRDVLSGLNLGNVDVLQNEQALLQGVDLEKIAALKRDVLSGLNLDHATDLEGVNVVQSTNGLLTGLNLEHILGRDVLSGLNLDNVADLKDVNVDQATNSILEGVNLESILKRVVGINDDIQDVDALKAADGLVEGLGARDVLSGLNLANTAGLESVNIAQTTNSLLSGLNVENILKRGVSDIVDGLDLDSVTSAPLSLVDLNRLTAIKRSGLLPALPAAGSVEGAVDSLDVASLLPALRRSIAVADVNFLTKGSPLAKAKVARDVNVDATLLDDSLTTLNVDLQGLLGKVVKMTEAVHTDSVESDVKDNVVPMVKTLAVALGNVVQGQPDALKTKVANVSLLADKVKVSVN